MAPGRPLFEVIWQQHRGVLSILMLLLVCCSGLFVATVVFIEPQLKTLQADRSALQQKLRQQQLVSQDGIPLTANEQIISDLKDFRSKVPSKEKLADFIGDLFVWADRAELVIEQIAYQPKAGSALEFIEYGLSFSVQGDYARLKKFIHALENSRRILIIDSIALSGRTGSDGVDDAVEDAVALNIKLTTYFQEKR